MALLIDRGAGVDKADSNGQTPLYVSALVSVNCLFILALICCNLIVFEIFLLFLSVTISIFFKKNNGL